MTIKKLKQAEATITRIEHLDGKIKELQDMARNIVNHGAKARIELRVEDKIEAEKAPKESIFDEDGFLKPNHNQDNIDKYIHSIMTGRKGGPPAAFIISGRHGMFQQIENQLNEIPNELNQFRDLSDTAALQILGILLEELQNERKELIAVLRKMGFKTVK